MIRYLKRIAVPAFLLLMLSTSCNQNPQGGTEKTKIKSMDSTTKVVETQTEKMKAQTKKVEESLEKLDSEFKPAE